MTKALLKRLEEGKLYYSISEVCQITGLEQHVLRYWENEFPQLKPKKNRSGNRAYRAKEIKLIRYIKYLLYDEMYTIQGAKRKIADASAPDLEGQINLLGPLPGLGAAAPSEPTSLPKKRKLKELVTTASEALPELNGPATAIAEFEEDADLESETVKESPQTHRELLLDLKNQLAEILRLFQLKSQ